MELRKKVCWKALWESGRILKLPTALALVANSEEKQTIFNSPQVSVYKQSLLKRCQWYLQNPTCNLTKLKMQVNPCTVHKGLQNTYCHRFDVQFRHLK